MAQGIRAAIEEMHLAAELAPDQAPMLNAVADMLTYEVDTRHELIGVARRGVLGGTAIMCSCGGMSIQVSDMPEPCGRLERAAMVAVAYTQDADLGADLLRRQELRAGRRSGRRRAR